MSIILVDSMRRRKYLETIKFGLELASEAGYRGQGIPAALRLTNQLLSLMHREVGLASENRTDQELAAAALLVKGRLLRTQDPHRATPWLESAFDRYVDLRRPGTVTQDHFFETSNHIALARINEMRGDGRRRAHQRALGAVSAMDAAATSMTSTQKRFDARLDVHQRRLEMIRTDGDNLEALDYVRRVQFEAALNDAHEFSRGMRLLFLASLELDCKHLDRAGDLSERAASIEEVQAGSLSRLALDELRAKILTTQGEADRGYEIWLHAASLRALEGMPPRAFPSTNRSSRRFFEGLHQRFLGRGKP